MIYNLIDGYVQPLRFKYLNKGACFVFCGKEEATKHCTVFMKVGNTYYRAVGSDVLRSRSDPNAEVREVEIESVNYRYARR